KYNPTSLINHCKFKRVKILYDSHGLRVTYCMDKNESETSNITAFSFKFTNYTTSVLQKVNFQTLVAHPMQLKMEPISSDSINTNSFSTQRIQIFNPNKQPFHVKYQIAFSKDNVPTIEQGQTILT
ncbi:hypothetical protein ROZALSC1DRAFT_28637, partial [Rozella allomycis CSF55]